MIYISYISRKSYPLSSKIINERETGQLVSIPFLDLTTFRYSSSPRVRNIRNLTDSRFILHTSKSKQTPKDYQFDYSDKKRSRIKTISQFHNLIISNEIQQDSHQMITDIRSFDNKDHDY